LQSFHALLAPNPRCASSCVRTGSAGPNWNHWGPWAAGAGAPAVAVAAEAHPGSAHGIQDEDLQIAPCGASQPEIIGSSKVSPAFFRDLGLGLTVEGFLMADLMTQLTQLFFCAFFKCLEGLLHGSLGGSSQLKSAGASQQRWKIHGTSMNI